MPVQLLVIDHDKTSANLMKEVFELKGATVSIVEDLQSGVAAISQQKFDGIFLELRLPEGDTVGFTKQIRGSAQNAQTIVVLVGHTASPRDVERGFAVGATMFLSKPYERNNLATRISAIRGLIVEERRRNRRIAQLQSAECRVGARVVQGCVIRNLSLDGMLLQADGSLKVHDKARIAFRLEQGYPLITAHGVVVRIDELGQAGIRVAWKSPEDRARVRMHISKEVDHL